MGPWAVDLRKKGIWLKLLVERVELVPVAVEGETAVAARRRSETTPVLDKHNNQETPTIVKSYYDKRIIGCPSVEGGKLLQLHLFLPC
ncbi:putative cytochrome c oxidase, subunit Vb [Rosa chinensis]|uniref:Putative cytochrome c oxidase, subunit Vb n=1 Tax=Rosa chinensis TaxID=74649 RepID=A0A2P6QHB6_ROSCH|nr:putative cytochrome c oxidase, subunit Vb [Rosa chinensis]